MEIPEKQKINRLLAFKGPVKDGLPEGKGLSYDAVAH